MNGTAAARRAGYASKSAHVAGSRLLSNDKVQAEIARLKAEVTSKLGVSVETVLHEHARIAFSNITNVMTFGPDGVEVRDSTDLAPDVSAVAEVICTKDGVRVRMHNKLQALGVLAEYVELTSPAPAPIVEARFEWPPPGVVAPCETDQELSEASGYRTGAGPEDDEAPTTMPMPRLVRPDDESRGPGSSNPWNRAVVRE